MTAPTCPHCGKPVDQGRHTKIGSGGGQDESGSHFVETRWRCDQGADDIALAKLKGIALRRVHDRTLCGTCNADVSEFVKTVVDVPGALLPCGHDYRPTNLVSTVKLVEATQ